MTRTDRSAPAAGTDPGLPELFVPDEEQWLNTTRSRVAPHPYSWLQAVHWVAGAGVYAARRKHGPKFGPTTIRIAELCAGLSPCRPGVAYLARRTGLGERTVKYHLQMLREAGLLVYAVRGTRIRGRRPQASEFVWAIPPVFDAALGIRTVGEGAQRRVVGIEEAGRTTIGKLGKKARRKSRKRSRTSTGGAGGRRVAKSAVSGSGDAPAEQPRCTPISGGCSTTSSDAGTCVPCEAKLASGDPTSHPTKKPEKSLRKRRLNRVGQRFRLARELTQQVPWLGRTDIARVAWAARHVADAGWTSTEVIAWLELMVAPDRQYHPAGLLTRRLHNAHKVWSTPKARAEALEAARDSRRAEKERHAGWEDGWQPPRDPAVLEQIRQTLASNPAETEEAAQVTLGDGDLPVLEDFTREQVVQMRRNAINDPAIVQSTVESIAATHGYEVAEAFARRLFSNHIVDQAHGTLASRHLVLHGSRGWA